jgi:bestrophin, other
MLDIQYLCNNFHYIFRQFAEAIIYCNNFSNLIPLSFVLGFFVNRVYSRFWDQLMLLPWPVKPAIYVSSYVRGRSEDSRVMRRSILRYLILSLVMTLSSISPQAKKRFPTLRHMTEAGKYTTHPEDVQVWLYLSQCFAFTL